MKTVLQSKDTANHGVLYMAIELSQKKWKFGFSNGERNRIRTIDARDWEALQAEIAVAKSKLDCTGHCQIESCYEAGRDGFWIHRALIAEGINNQVLDSASIEVNRRQKQVKTDRVDVIALLRLLIRYHSGEKQALHTIRIPTVGEEDNRRLNRERDRLIKERGAHSARIKSLLITHGIVLEKLNQLPRVLLTAKAIPATQKIQRLRRLKGVGWQSSWGLTMEFFNWRAFKNAKQVGACAGLTPTPYDSGNSTREQGISKAGNKRIRRLMVELSWLWLRYQPKSQLSQWFETRFGQGGKRMRRIGIVALARKLLIALWRYLEQGVIPEGAVFKVV